MIGFILCLFYRLLPSGAPFNAQRLTAETLPKPVSRVQFADVHHFSYTPAQPALCAYLTSKIVDTLHTSAKSDADTPKRDESGRSDDSTPRLPPAMVTSAGVPRVYCVTVQISNFKNVLSLKILGTRGDSFPQFFHVL
jgi:hypothetical protein